MFVEGGSRTYVRGLGSASTTVGPERARADLNITRADGWREAHAVRAAERHAALGLPAGDRAGSRRWRRSPTSISPATAAATSPPRTSSAATRTYTPIAFRRVKAARLSTELQVRGEPSSFGATLYARYNELDLLALLAAQLRSADLGEPQPLGRPADPLASHVAPLRTNLSTGVDLEYSPGSRMETGIVAAARRGRSSPATPRARSSTTTTSPSTRRPPTRRPTWRCLGGCT